MFNYEIGSKQQLIAVSGIITIAAIALIMMFYQLPNHSLLFRELQNSGHTIAFTSITIVLRIILSTLCSGSSQRSLNLYAFCLALIIGIAIESLHFFTARDASLGDILLNSVGSLVGLLLIVACITVDKSIFLRITAVLAAALITAACFIAPFRIWLALEHQSQQFPVLQNFESSYIDTFVKPVYGGQLTLVSAPIAWQDNSSNVMRVNFPIGRWPGIKLMEPSSGWYNYERLRFDIFSEAEKAFTVIFRINDKQHTRQYKDRYNQTLIIQPGVNQFNIKLDEVKNAPVSRTLDLDNIQQLIWYINRPQKNYRIYLDNIHLDKKPSTKN